MNKPSVCCGTISRRLINIHRTRIPGVENQGETKYVWINNHFFKFNENIKHKKHEKQYTKIHYHQITENQW